jgi:hypothetical protein
MEHNLSRCCKEAIFDLKGLKKAIINSWKKVIIEKELCQT